MSDRFIQGSRRSLGVSHALGGAAGEDLSTVEQSWRDLTTFGSTVPDSVLRRADRYVMRWKNIYNWAWFQTQCKSAKGVQALLRHLNNKVYINVTIIYDLRLALTCFVRCNTTGTWLEYIHAALLSCYGYKSRGIGSMQHVSEYVVHYSVNCLLSCLTKYV